MKNIALNIFLLLACPFLALAQTSPVDYLFDKYAEQDGFTTVYISSFMFSMLQKFSKDEKDDDIKQLINKLEGIKILTMDDNKNAEKVNFYKEVMANISLKEYKELMVVKEKGQEIKMLLKEPKDGENGEFLMVGHGDDNMLISIVGKIDIESLSKLSGSMGGLKGMDKLKNIEPKDSTKKE